MNNWRSLLVFFYIATMLGGCISWRVTNPPRTAVEQLLLSTAIDRAVARLDLGDVVKGKKVHLDVEQLEAVDKPYLVAALHERLGMMGAFILPSAEGAEIIIEARSGGLAIDKFNFMLGIPALSLPVPETLGSIATPKLPLISKERQTAIAKIGLFARQQDGRPLGATGPKSGHAYFNTWIILFFPIESTDIPEKLR